MKKLIFIIIFTLIIGSLPSLFINMDISSLYKPFYIPPILFPIVWTILFILMSISYYLVREEEGPKLYLIQLFVNALWSVIFFGLKLRLLAFFWLLLLLTLIIIMSIKYFKISKLSGYLLIPYILWVTFAGYLNLSIYLLNK